MTKSKNKLENLEDNNCQNCDSVEKGIFCDLEQASLMEVSNSKSLNFYKKGQTLFSQGDAPLGVFCVKKGNIKLTKVGAEGKETILRIAHDGDLIGHRSLLAEDAYQATAIAMEDTTICFLEKNCIKKLILKNPSISYNLIQKLSVEMGAAEGKFSSIHQKNVKQRLAELLLTFKTSHGIYENNKWKIDLKITREEMATMIGTAPETLIRSLAELKEENLVEISGKILYLIDLNGLLDIAEINH